LKTGEIMKSIRLGLLAALILSASLPLHAEDAQAVPNQVLKTTIAPYFSIAPSEWGNTNRAPLLFLNAGLAVEYGVTSWLSPFVSWIPGANVFSSLDAGDFGLFGDLDLGLRGQIIGSLAPISRENMRLSVALEMKAPLPSGSETAAEPAHHLWGAGIEINYDYIFNPYFFLSFHTEAIHYPPQPLENMNFGPGDRRVNHPLDFLVQLEPHGSYPINDSVVLKGSLPLTYSMSLESTREGNKLDDASQRFTLGPVFTASFTQFTIPFDLSIQYRAAVYGTGGFASHDVILSGTLYIPIVELINKRKAAKNAASTSTVESESPEEREGWREEIER
jgi:hypothetical protein